MFPTKRSINLIQGSQGMCHCTIDLWRDMIGSANLRGAKLMLLKHSFRDGVGIIFLATRPKTLDDMFTVVS